MEKKIVKIPHIAEELRIGYSFNYLIKVIAETDAAVTVQWDFADANFLHPIYVQFGRFNYLSARRTRKSQINSIVNKM